VTVATGLPGIRRAEWMKPPPTRLFITIMDFCRPQPADLTLLGTGRERWIIPHMIEEYARRNGHAD